MGRSLDEVESGCVVVEAMWTAGKYLRVPISALLLKQLDFKLYTKHLLQSCCPGMALNSTGAAQAY
jgi:hypothetical protein